MHGWALLQAILFAAASGAIAYVSRRPLRVPGSHGFYRFFAWEAILALLVLNLPVWFRQPLAPAQLASWIILTSSAFLPIHAVRLFRRVGGSGARAPAPAQDDAGRANYEFENTAHLVEVGAYRFIRHPMYASLLYLAWGIHLKRPTSPLGFALALAASLLLWLTARADEAECRRTFGPAYVDYMRRTRMFIPFVF